MQASKMKSFETIFNDQKPLNIVAKLSVLDICEIRGCGSVLYS